MPKLKRLSGKEIIKIFDEFGFVVISRVGSHVKLRRIKAVGEKQTLIVPDHTELDTGTCRAIYRQATRFIDPDDLRPFFFSD